MRYISLITLLFSLICQAAAADGPWQGRWKDSYGHETTFLQDGSRVYGDIDADEWIDGTLSPDGTVLRGFWVLGNRAGYFEHTLAPDGQSYEGFWTEGRSFTNGTRKNWSGNLIDRNVGPLIHSFGPMPNWPDLLEKTDADVVAWMNFSDGAGNSGGGNGGGGDTFDDAEIINFAAGNLGYWNISENGTGIGVMAVNQVTPFSTGYGRLKIDGFGGGDIVDIQMRWGGGRDEFITLTNPQTGETRTDKVVVRELEGDQLAVTSIIPVLGRDPLRLSLNLRNGTIPSRSAPGEYGLATLFVGVAFELRDGINDTDNVIGHVPANTQNARLDDCISLLTPFDRSLRETELRDRLRTDTCHISVDGQRGWVPGRIIRR